MCATTTVTVTRRDENGNENADAAKRKTLPTMDEIRAAVPASCFERSLAKSLGYLALDAVVIYGLYATVWIWEGYGGWLGLLAWYWVLGMYLSSLFCVGHDAGHGTFSEYEWVNDIFGHVAHAPIMVPFWPWQKSHREHHKHTSHIDKDKGHPWVTEKDYQERNLIERYFAPFPLSGFVRFNPVYTIVGLPDGSHFWPWSRLFDNNVDRAKCAFSSLLCVACAGVALHLCNYSAFTFIKYYYIPLLFQSFWMVMITYLQHQNESIEVYEEGSWNYVRGQMQTIDRVYGFGIDTMLHHITDGHVAHHLFFTRIPHYNLPEATRAIRRALQPYPGAYKRRWNPDFVWEFLRLNVRLHYLVGRGTGVLRYYFADKTKKET